MYFQLTTRCNMKCPHCCFAATNKGHDMSSWTFITALTLASNYGEYITLGGGEPTVHPMFFDFLDKCIEWAEQGAFELSPMVITNGKLVTKARKLLDYVEDERMLHVELSQDDWHDPIRPEIVNAFQRHQKRRDARRYDYSISNENSSAGIRSVSSIIPVGRAIEFSNALPMATEAYRNCACEDLLVDPFGNIFSCGCKTHLLGNVHEGESILDDILANFDRDQAHEGGGLPSREFARRGPEMVQAA